MLISELEKLTYSQLETYTFLELEHSDFNADSFYGHSNFNLVEKRVSLCDTQLSASNIQHNSIDTTKVNWTKNNLPVTPDFNRIESNLKALDLPNSFVKKRWIELQPFDFEDANRWEEQSETLLHIVTNIQHNWKRCGNYTCGG